MQHLKQNHFQFYFFICFKNLIHTLSFTLPPIMFPFAKALSATQTILINDLQCYETNSLGIPIYGRLTLLEWVIQELRSIFCSHSFTINPDKIISFNSIDTVNFKEESLLKLF